MNEATSDLVQLCQRLGLQMSQQDWGIENADPSRLREFIHCYVTVALTGAQRHALYELIMASANDGLVDGSYNRDTEALIREFLSGHIHDVPAQRDYWLSLTSGDEFPITKLLHEYASPPA